MTCSYPARPIFFVFLQDDIDRLNDTLVAVGFAVNDHIVNSLFHPRHIDRMLLRKPVIPAAVPSSEEVGVFLKSVCKLSASQLLHIDVTVAFA